MKKQGIKLTSKVLTGLVLLTGITSLPTNAVEVKTAAVDVNKASVKAKVYELNGHYYAKLVADKEVANVVARITTETKSEFVLKKDLIKAGEEVVVELDMTAKAPTRKLPNTEVKREGYTAVNKVGTHTFNINVRYEIATDEVKAKQKETTKPVSEPKKDDTSAASATSEQQKGNEAETKTAQPATNAPAENTKSAEAQKTAETTVARPNTSDNEKPADKPAGLDKQPTTPVAGTDRSAVATPAKEDTKAAEAKAQAAKDAEAKAEKEAKEKAEKAKQQTPAAPVAGTREEQIRKAFLAKVAQLRSINGLPALSENAALNTSSKNRSADVPTRAIDGNIHGPNGTIQYETNAARAAGYANYILANIAISSDSGTPEQVAQQLFDILFKEIGNVVPAYPYGHRNTLLDETAKDVGAGVTIKNGQVYLVQHQSSNGAFNGTTPKAGKYLDGSTKVFLNGK